MKKNTQRRLELVVNNPIPEEQMEEVVTAGAKAGRSILGETVVSIASRKAPPREADKEKEAVERAATHLAIGVAQLNDMYNPEEKRDIPAAQLYNGLIFLSQAGRQHELWLDMFADHYVKPTHPWEKEAKQKTEDETARLVSSIEVVQDAFDFIGPTSEDKSTLAERIEQFQVVAGKSRVWEDPSRVESLLKALADAHVIVAKMARQEGLETSAWLGACGKIISEKGLGVKFKASTGDERAVYEYNQELNKRIDKAWKAWLPPISRTPWV